MNKKKLDRILEGLEITYIEGNKNTEVTSIAFDSRKVLPGSLFVALKGTKTDGNQFIKQAIEAGAIAIMSSELPQERNQNITWIKVPDAAIALGQAASNFYGNPSSKLRLIGITGTNGKTTIATLLYHLFTKIGYKCGLFSTISNYIAGKEYPATHTTPDPVQLNSLMAEMVKENCTYVFMEVSSHAIDQKRISGLKYAGGIFTNITHDHLDYHKTFANYLAAKKAFFDSLEPESFALINADDKNSKVMVQNCRARKYTYSIGGMADFRASVIEQSLEGMELRIDGEEVWTNFVGEFNASNLLAVYATAILLGEGKKETLTYMSGLKPAAGRLEVIRGNTPVTGIVDYAHTPDALMKVTDTINKLLKGNGRLITVVGAGGDRDRSKRPVMAAICAEKSSIVILTSDNPRSEDPEKIIDEMVAGITSEAKEKVIRIADRKEAIKTAVMMANPGDVVLVAGKGHETYQEVRGVRHHFDDREELSKALLLKM
ncbi:MAG: UDP-N-acetylmuramoyl-L-alanyl-D-glutamate--2,6-diaminopimelate ligase [Bacteroidales bacterium]|nr:UDP-N-acetylmuramoyl-L-alanyl-D-glutamate--2,6-diaminopimelate ligase [Bacteroidales bacterium]